MTGAPVQKRGPGRPVSTGGGGSNGGQQAEPSPAAQASMDRLARSLKTYMFWQSARQQSGPDPLVDYYLNDAKQKYMKTAHMTYAATPNFE